MEQTGPVVISCGNSLYQKRLTPGLDEDQALEGDINLGSIRVLANETNLALTRSAGQHSTGTTRHWMTQVAINGPQTTSDKADATAEEVYMV